MNPSTLDDDNADMSAASAAPRGSILLVLAVAIVVVVAVVVLMFLGRQQAQPYILGLLALLAMVGLFAVFAWAAGILRFRDASGGNLVSRAVTDNAFDGIVVTDAQGHVVYANEAYLQIANATSIEDARPVERVFMGDPDVSEAIYRMLKAAREGRRQQEEMRVAPHAQAPVRWLRLRVRPLSQSRRDAKFSVWTVADITREREGQENVFQELRHAIDYLDHAPAGFFSVNAQGDIVYLNATLAAWLDHDLAQVGSGGLKLNDIIAGDGAALLGSGSPIPGDVRTEVLDIDLRMRSGKTLPVRLYHKVAFGADGEPGLSRTLVLNRARAETGGMNGSADAQRAAEVRFMRFFNNSPIAIATIDQSGAIILHNARFARLTQGIAQENASQSASQRADQQTGHGSILNVAAERDRASLQAAIARAAEGQGDIAPVEIMLAGAGERWAQFFVSAIAEGEARTEAVIVYALETTEKRSLENQFTQSQKMQAVGQLAGGIAHDFNNVLSAIMMATDFLLSAHKPTDPPFQDIMQIKQNANRAASLVRQLLAFSRRQTLRPQVLDLGDVLNDLSMLLRRLIGAKVKLDVVHARDLWPVKADLSQFEQVVINFAVNARDAMPDGGALTVRTANIAALDAAQLKHKGMPAADYVLVEVSDTGTGIPLDIQDKIFEPFFSTKDIGKGTGLGLSTVYGIVKQTGGFVYVDSEPGRGTAFRVYLPRHVPGAEAEDNTAAPAPAKSVAADLTGQGTILLVDDEDSLRSLNARGLRSRGYTVVEACNGVEAIEMFDEHQGAVDLIVSDVVMPEMDGPTLLKALRERKPGIKMILVSGYAEDAFEKSLPEGEQFVFLPKPFTLSQLVASVKETLAKA